MGRWRAPFALIGALVAGLLTAGGSVRAADPCSPEPRLVAGTRLGPEDGIGGTGHTDGDSGIGGTGIFGTITGFASLCVNGLRIGIDGVDAVEINGQRSDIGDLAVGQLVWVEAFAVERGLRAEKISVFSAAIGRIEALDAQHRRLRVSGQAIEVPLEAIVLDLSGRRAIGLSELEVGDLVDVSGLRRPDRHIVATRIVETTGPPREDVGVPDLGELVVGSPGLRRLSIEGFLQHREGSGALRIGGLPVDASALGILGELDPKRRVWLEATPTPDRTLRARRLIVRPPLPPGSPGPQLPTPPRVPGALDPLKPTHPGEPSRRPPPRDRLPHSGIPGGLDPFPRPRALRPLDPLPLPDPLEIPEDSIDAIRPSLEIPENPIDAISPSLESPLPTPDDPAPTR